MKKILWISTGGTIASVPTSAGLVPASMKKGLRDVVSAFLDEIELINFEIYSLDSSNIQPEEWCALADKIHEMQHEVDGILCTHGTDTLAYTASALSYMLGSVSIPVVLTGSQLPLHHVLSDGVDNLRTALAMASSAVPGVYVAFNRHIILGTRAVKVRTQGFDAFESVNFEYAGKVDSRGLVINQQVIQFPVHSVRFKRECNKDVLLVKLIPGMNPEIFDAFLRMGIKGIVIEAFGIGGLSFERRDLITKLKNLVDHGVIVVVKSQCLYENSDFNIYEVGKKALDIGVIEAYDMTSEATVTKLMCALSITNCPEKIKQIMHTNSVNEINIKGDLR